MTDPTTNHERERLDVSAEAVLAVLPSIGKVMVATSRLGATHERIGRVERVILGDGRATLTGGEHDSRIDTSLIANVIVDRTSRMGERAFPRIEFQTADEKVLFSVVGFDGLEPFDAALASFEPGTPLDLPTPTVPGERGDVAPDDPGSAPFEKAIEAASTHVIGIRLPGFEQNWTGIVEAVKPARGFINVMRPDFHLHLKAGAVARWKAEGDELHAQTEDGTPLGLFIAPTSSTQRSAS